MKRKLFLMVIAAVSVLVMASCGQKGSNDNSSADQVTAEDEELDEDDAPAPKTEEGVIAMLQSVYTDANLVSQPEDDMEVNLDLFGMYCSRDFNEKVHQIRSIESRTGNHFEVIPDELGMFIYWEGQTVSISDIDVAVDGNEASATYNLSNGEDEMMTAIELVYENGQWRIDDWEQIGMLSVNIKAMMDEFIEENQ